MKEHSILFYKYFSGEQNTAFTTSDHTMIFLTYIYIYNILSALHYLELYIS